MRTALEFVAIEDRDTYWTEQEVYLPCIRKRKLKQMVNLIAKVTESMTGEDVRNMAIGLLYTGMGFNNEIEILEEIEKDI